jgi:signal transduction histidine kinase
VTNASFGWVLAMAPVILAWAGLIGCVDYAIVGVSPASRPLERATLTVLGMALTALALWSAPLLLQAYGGLARVILGPREDPALARRVRHLAQTRSETIDAGAAEIRRIERDLHDGAQARLVAMGMTLGAAEDLLDTDPEATRKLLVEARQASGKALAELRALVSGVHPPVLADRGLVDAIRALALDSVPRVEVTADPIGRPPPPVESAAYFAVSELLANVTKHAEARQAWIDIRYRQGMLAICVTDDGRGGADQGRGTGLRGIERRLAAFDGVLALSSPPGGPTVVQLEIPCELS